jgi:hypothetical protein
VEHKKKDVCIINYTQDQSWDFYLLFFLFFFFFGLNWGWTQGILFVTMESPNSDVLRSPMHSCNTCLIT